MTDPEVLSDRLVLVSATRCVAVIALAGSTLFWMRVATKRDGQRLAQLLLAARITVGCPIGASGSAVTTPSGNVGGAGGSGFIRVTEYY
jgi:hypothetical protein